MKVFIAFLLAQLVCAQVHKPLFTEDFEAGKLDSRVWAEQTTGESILKVQSDRAAHGKYALLARNPGPAQKTYAFIIAKDIPVPLRKHHYGRAYMYVTPSLPARHTIFVTAGTAGFPRNKYQEVATLNGRFQLTYVDQVDGGEDWHSGGDPVPLNKWFCLEWEFNDDPDQATIWVDGQKIYDTPFTFRTAGGNNLVGGFSDVAFGFRLWGAGPQAFDIYYDDISLDTKPIGPIH